MRRKETVGRTDFLKGFWRVAVAGLLGLTFWMTADQGHTNAQSVPEERNVSGATKATEEEASFTVWIEHQAEGYMLRCSGVQLFDYLIVSALHCVNDGQDYLFDTQSTSIYFPTAPERGAVHPIRIFPLFFDLVGMYIGAQPAGNVKSIPLADALTNYADKNLKVIGNGGDGESGFTKWPNTGSVEVTDACVDRENFVAVMSIAGLNVQGEPGDSGGGLTEEQVTESVTKRSLIGIASNFCTTEDQSLKPVQYILIHTGPNRVAISDTVQLIQDKQFTMPPTTNTVLYLNDSIASWGKFNKVNIQADEIKDLNYSIYHSNPTGLSTISLTSSETTAQFVPECVIFQGSSDTRLITLLNGENPIAKFSVQADCSEEILSPYATLDFMLSSTATLEQSFNGSKGIEVISSDEELNTRISIHEPIELDLSSLSQAFEQQYDDGVVVISTTLDSDVLTVSVESTKRPLYISLILIEGNRKSEIIEVAIPWTIPERENPGALLQRSATLKRSEIIPALKQTPLYIPFLSK